MDFPQIARLKPTNLGSKWCSCCHLWPTCCEVRKEKVLEKQYQQTFIHNIPFLIQYSQWIATSIFYHISAHQLCYYCCGFAQGIK